MVDVNVPFLFSGGSADITPTKKIPLSGFAPRTEPFSSVGTPLEVNAILLRNGSTKIVFVNADLLYIGKELRTEVLRRSKDVLREEELFMSSTHDHYAPATDPAKPLLGKTDGEYLEFVIDKVSHLVRSVLSADPQPVTGTYSIGTNHTCSINRRRFGRIRSWVPRKEMLRLPNPDGCTDPAIRVLTFNNTAGDTVSAAWNFCCHPAGYHDSSSVSSDYPGAVRAMLRAKYGTMPILFWQGFSGNVNPPAFLRRPRILSRKFPEYVVFKLLNGREFGPYTSGQWEEWVNRLGESVVRVTVDESRVRVEEKIELKRKTIPLRSLGFESDDELVFHRVSLGGIKILGISAEPVAEYVQILEKMFPGAHIIPVGCIDKTTLYLPTKEMLAEGGYEANGFAKYFGLSGSYVPDFQDRVEQVLRSL